MPTGLDPAMLPVDVPTCDECGEPMELYAVDLTSHADQTETGEAMFTCRHGGGLRTREIAWTAGRRGLVQRTTSRGFLTSVVR